MNHGLFDWWAQRVSSMLISLFALPVLYLWYAGVLVTSLDWYLFLSSQTGKFLTLIGLVGLVAHAKIGLWVVITDYLPRTIQVLVTRVIYLLLLGMLVWGVYLVLVI